MKTLSLNQQTIDFLIKKYHNHSQSTNNKYILTNITTPTLNLDIYLSGKAVFKKDHEHLYFSLLKKANPNFIIGADETGVGDILAPLVICAVYLDDN